MCVFTNFTVVCEGFEFTKAHHVNLCHTFFYWSRADIFWQRVGGEIIWKTKGADEKKKITRYKLSKTEENNFWYVM